jgi:Restriction endonuclease AspBHI N-terminal
MSDAVPFDQLATADLYVDRVYEGGPSGNVADDPLQRLLPVGNQGGFRYRGSLQRGDLRLVVLYSSGEDPDWPERSTLSRGTSPISATTSGAGAGFMRLSGAVTTSAASSSKLPTEVTHRGSVCRRSSSSLRAKGDAISCLGDSRLREASQGQVRPGGDLVAVWRTAQGHRFQNYRATFTILDQGLLQRSWLNDILAGEPLSKLCPLPWRAWVERGIYIPLISARLDVRSRSSNCRKRRSGAPSSPLSIPTSTRRLGAPLGLNGAL